MIKYIKIVFQIILFGNLFTCLCACCLSIFSFNFFSKTPQINDFTAILSSGIFIALGYQFPYLLSKNWFASSSRASWIATHTKALKVLATFELIVFLYLLFQMNLFQVLLYLHLGVLGWCYYAGFSWSLKLSKTNITLRNLPYMKTLCIGYVWAIATIAIPLQPYWESFNDVDYAILMAMRFTLIAILCLIFDMRDIVQDTKDQVPTLPVKYGLLPTYRIIWVMLLIYMCGMFYRWGYTPISFGMGAVCLWVIALLHWQKQRKDDLFYLLLVDGTTVLPVFIFYTIEWIF